MSPLVSLMMDQVMFLESKGITSCALSSMGIVPGALTKLANGQLSVVFVTPEGLPNRLTQLGALHKAHGVSLVAVDEAHCVSEWGHDFRPDYRNIASLRQHLPGVPFLAVTATATDQVCSTPSTLCSTLSTLFSTPSTLCSTHDPL